MLNENQARHVRSTLTYLDSLLDAVERLTRTPLSPLAHERSDLAPDEARLIRAFVQSTRERMIAALERLGLEIPEPAISAKWSITVTLTSAEIALADLRREGLKGYGEIESQFAVELEAVADDLTQVLRQGRALLREAEAGGLEERVGAISGEVGEILRAIEAITRDRGLAVVRPLLAAAAERAAADSLEVGVFGMVSSGKSSLINALVGAELLPVGAIPVSAVPVRIGAGDQQVVVRYRDGAPQSVLLTDLAAFATEAGNPRNRLGIRAIDITVPSMRPGLVLLDTPGVGSLLASGSAQTFAWLPRCDLGLILIPATAVALGDDEAALIRGLTHAGVSCRLLLSKCDLLEPAETTNALEYLREETHRAIPYGPPIPVDPVSSRLEGRSLLELFRQRVLDPLVADRLGVLRDALRVRLHRLIADTAVALDGRATVHDRHLVDRHQRRAQAQASIQRASDSLARAAPVILGDAATAVAAAWRRQEDGAAAAKQTLLATPQPALAEIDRAIASARAGETEPAITRLPPLFDPDLSSIGNLPLPGLTGRLRPEATARHRLATLEASFPAALQRFASRLEAWAMQRLEETLAGAVEPVENQQSPLPPELAALDRRVETALLAHPATASAPNTSR